MSHGSVNYHRCLGSTFNVFKYPLSAVAELVYLAQSVLGLNEKGFENKQTCCNHLFQKKFSF